jgi:hypothetical protein
MTLGPTEPLTDMSTSNIPVGSQQTVRETDNLTAICEPTV